MKELDTPELFMFRGYLKALSYCNTAANYLSHFEVKGYDLAGAQFDVIGVLKHAYPECAPDHGNIDVISPDEIVERVTKCLKTPKLVTGNLDDATRRSVHAVEEYHDAIQMDLVSGFWKMLRACINYKRANIISYDPTVDADIFDVLKRGVWWYFTYIIHNRQRQRCVIIHGGASD